MDSLFPFNVTGNPKSKFDLITVQVKCSILNGIVGGITLLGSAFGATVGVLLGWKWLG